MHNESVELHILSIEGSDKTRIRRTNGTPHCVLVSAVRWLCAKRACLCGQVLIHKKRVLFVSPLFVRKLSDFQLRAA